MILENLKKILKRNCKNQGRNITLGMTVAFLLGSLGAYGADITIGLDLSDKITITGATPEELSNINVADKTITFGENFVTNKQITFEESAFDAGINIVNNGKIEVVDTTLIEQEEASNIGNGIGILNYSTNCSTSLGTIMNENGVISGTTGELTENYFNNIGNGIGVLNYSDYESFECKIGDITNKNGIISGTAGKSIESYCNNLGNGIGILNDSERKKFKNEIGNITNKNGVISGISGEIESSAHDNIGNGIGIFTYSLSFSSGMIENINGAITGVSSNIDQSNGSNIGNGIGISNYFEDESFENKIGGITNENGVISGIAGNIANSGGQNNIGNGIGTIIYSSRTELADTIGNITNKKGIINGASGKISSQFVNNIGNGIGNIYFSPKFDLNEIRNDSGTISGVSSEIEWSAHDNIGNGIGIYVYSETESSKMHIDNLVNENGAIRGKSDKIILSENSNIGNGVGIYIYSKLEKSKGKTIDNLINKNGIISGEILELGDKNNQYGSYSNNAGNGIGLYSNITASMNNLTNTGAISGYSGIISKNSEYNNAGNGIGVYSKFKEDSSNEDTISINTLTNTGNISGYVVDDQGTENNAGNGIGVYSAKGEVSIKDFTNAGTIAGKKHGVLVKGKDDTSKIETYKNYGVIAGQIPLGAKINGDISPEDKGYTITLNENGSVQEVVGKKGTSGSKYSLDIFSSGTSSDYFILNTEISNTKDDAWQEFNTDITNTIVNGAGVASGVITVTNGSTASLTNGIVNAYKTAVTVRDEATFTGTDIIINGGGLRGSDSETEVIKGTDLTNNLNLAGNTQINGSIDLLGAGDNDNLTFGSENQDINTDIKIYHDIKNAENINLKGNTDITLFETAKVTGTNAINIESGSQLTLRVDSSKEDKDGTYKTHALYNSTNNQLVIKGDTDKIQAGDVNADGDFELEENEGQTGYDKVSILNLATSGLGRSAKIDLGNTKVEDTVWVKTDSILTKAEKAETGTNTTVTIEAEKDLFSINKKVPDQPTDPVTDKLYVNLNEIYKGIHSSDDRNFNALNDIVTNYTFEDKDKGDYTIIGNDNMQMAALLGYLKEIYTNSPYSFTSDASRKSMGMFRDIIRENNFKALDDEWIIYGGLTHNDGSREQTYYGKNYHKFDTGAYDNSADIKITGAYAQAEYGIDNTLSAGVLFGGNKSDIEVSHSKADGTLMYLGGYLKKDIRDFRITAGAGIQYSEYDAERNMSNRQYDDKYSDNAFDIYVNTKYFYEISEGLFFEPYGQFSYSYVDQEGISENDGALSLNVDDKDFTFAEGTIGADLRKEIIKDNIKYNFKAGVSYTRLLDGYKEDNLTADFGGSSFDLLVPHKTPDELRIGVRYELERTDGLMFSANADYLISMDSKDNGHKNENKDEWRIGAGIGYRF